MPVIPPAVGFFRLFKETEGIDEADIEQGAKGDTLQFGNKYISSPCNRIVNIPIFRRDVVISQEREIRIFFLLFFQPVTQCPEPFDFVPVFV